MNKLIASIGRYAAILPDSIYKFFQSIITQNFEQSIKKFPEDSASEKWRSKP